jgi:hypothetical protein
MPTVGFNVETWTHKFKAPGSGEQEWDAVGSVEAYGGGVIFLTGTCQI